MPHTLAEIQHILCAFYIQISLRVSGGIQQQQNKMCIKYTKFPMSDRTPSLKWTCYIDFNMCNSRRPICQLAASRLLYLLFEHRQASIGPTWQAGGNFPFILYITFVQISKELYRFVLRNPHSNGMDWTLFPFCDELNFNLILLFIKYSHRLSPKGLQATHSKEKYTIYNTIVYHTTNTHGKTKKHTYQLYIVPWFLNAL